MARAATYQPSRGPRPSLWYYRKDVAIVRVAWNWAWMTLAKYMPWFRVKNWLLRRTGMRIGKGVAIGYGAQPDLLFPQDIHLEDDCIIGYGTTLLCHGYLVDRYERGRILVGERATVGAGCTILSGVRIGAGAVVGAMSLVNADIPPGETWGGVPARRLAAPGVRADQAP